MSEIKIFGIKNLPEIGARDDLVALIAASVRDDDLEILDGDVFVVAQKVVSKAEGRVVGLDSVSPSRLACEWGERYDKDPRLVEVVLSQSRRIVRMERGVIIAETNQGFICANAGVDVSNTPEGTVVLLPADADASARKLRSSLEAEFRVQLGVIVSDTFGRPWREGQVNVALGVAGIAPLRDYRGKLDSFGRSLRVTVIAVADELASAAELVMRKSDRIPAAIVRGYAYEVREATASELIRPAEQDLFR